MLPFIFAFALYSGIVAGIMATNGSGSSGSSGHAGSSDGEDEAARPVINAKRPRPSAGLPLTYRRRWISSKMPMWTQPLVRRRGLRQEYGQWKAESKGSHINAGGTFNGVHLRMFEIACSPFLPLVHEDALRLESAVLRRDALEAVTAGLAARKVTFKREAKKFIPEEEALDKAWSIEHRLLESRFLSEVEDDLKAWEEMVGEELEEAEFSPPVYFAPTKRTRKKKDDKDGSGNGGGGGTGNGGGGVGGGSMVAA